MIHGNEHAEFVLNLNPQAHREQEQQLLESYNLTKISNVKHEHCLCFPRFRGGPTARSKMK